MEKRTTRNIRLGIMVATGLGLLIAALYFIGSNQNLFGSTIKIKAHFRNVNGLTEGNNVRYAGIDVGTVSKIEIMNDSLVVIEMTIDSDAKQYIRKSAVARIGTDGLMGNKLVNINSAGNTSPLVTDGDFLASVEPLDSDVMMRTLSGTNEDIYLIAENLKNITSKIDSDNVVWHLLSDTVIANNISNTMHNIEQTSMELSNLTKSFQNITNDVKRGEGMIGTLLYDTVIVEQMNATLKNVQAVSDSLAQFSENLSSITNRVNRGEGAAGKLLVDEKFENDLNESMENIKNASKSLDENMEALRHNFLFRGYFKKEKKKEEKEAKENK